MYLKGNRIDLELKINDLMIYDEKKQLCILLNRDNLPNDETPASASETHPG